MSSGCVVGTIRTAIWLPLRLSKSFSFCLRAAVSAARAVPVWSVTRAVNVGTATSADANDVQQRNAARARRICRTSFIAGPAPAARCFARSGGADGVAGEGDGAGVDDGALKSALGAVDISRSLSTAKFA